MAVLAQLSPAATVDGPSHGCPGTGRRPRARVAYWSAVLAATIVLSLAGGLSEAGAADVWECDFSNLTEADLAELADNPTAENIPCESGSVEGSVAEVKQRYKDDGYIDFQVYLDDVLAELDSADQALLQGYLSVSGEVAQQCELLFDDSFRSLLNAAPETDISLDNIVLRWVLICPGTGGVTKVAATDALSTVVSSAVSNVTTNIGARFSASRGGANLSLARSSRALEEVYGGGVRDAGREQPGPELDNLMRSANFETVLAATEGTQVSPPSQWTFWGRGDFQHFSSEPRRGPGFDGDLRAGYLGIDMQVGKQALVGVAVSRTAAAADYTPEGSSSDGKMDISLTSLLPYVRLAAGSGTELWAILGAGRGEVENRQPGASAPQDSDLTLWMLAAGGRRAMDTGGWMDLALLGDFNTGRVDVDKGTQAIAGLTVDVWRARLGAEGSRTTELAEGGAVTLFLEVAGRIDGGDGDDEKGLELSPGVYFSNPSSGVGLELRGRVLALHSADEYEEYGLTMTASVSPSLNGAGLSLSVSPSWGTNPTTADTLWREDGFNPLTSSSDESRAMSLNARIGYGTRVPRGLLTPFAELGMSNQDHRRLRIGARFARGHSGTDPATLELASEWRELPSGDAEQWMGVTGRLRF